MGVVFILANFHLFKCVKNGILGKFSIEILFSLKLWALKPHYTMLWNLKICPIRECGDWGLKSKCLAKKINSCFFALQPNTLFQKKLVLLQLLLKVWYGKKIESQNKRKVLLFNKSLHSKYLFTPGVNFTNILQAAFTPADPKSAKKTVKLSSLIALLGSVCVKAAPTMLVKLTPMLHYNLGFGDPNC